MKRKSLIIAIVVFIIDILIKYIVDKSFYYGILKSIIPNFFYLTKVYNTGAAWSTFSGERLILIIVALLALIFLIKYQSNFKENKWSIVAFGMVYGGLAGNLFDRLVNGYVIDYLKFYIFGYEYPVFNLADICLVVGFIIIGVAIFKGWDKYGSNM